MYILMFVLPGVRCIAGALRNVLQSFPTQRYVSKKRLAALQGIPWSCLSGTLFCNVPLHRNLSKQKWRPYFSNVRFVSEL